MQPGTRNYTNQRGLILYSYRRMPVPTQLALALVMGVTTDDDDDDDDDDDITLQWMQLLCKCLPGGQLSYLDCRHVWLKSMRSSLLPPWLVSVELTDPPAEEGAELIPLSWFTALTCAALRALDCSYSFMISILASSLFGLNRDKLCKTTGLNCFKVNDH